MPPVAISQNWCRRKESNLDLLITSQLLYQLSYAGEEGELCPDAALSASRHALVLTCISAFGARRQTAQYSTRRLVAAEQQRVFIRAGRHKLIVFQIKNRAGRPGGRCRSARRSAPSARVRVWHKN